MRLTRRNPGARRPRGRTVKSPCATTALALGLSALALAAPLDGASAQTAGAPAPSDPRYLDSRQRAERDLELLTKSAADLWSGAEAALSSPYGAAALLALAAAFGGFLGAGLRGGKRAPEPAPASARQASRGGRPERRGEDDPRVAEATRLFTFFHERFGLEEASAEAAVEYLTRLGGSIDHLRQRADEAERRAADADRRLEETERGALEAERRAADAERRATEAERRAARPQRQTEERGDSPVSVIHESVRLIRAAMQSLRGDPDFDAFSAAVGLDEAARALAGLRGALQDGRYTAGGDLIEEPWPHALFRAEALLATYYPAVDAWLDLRTGVAAASTGLRILLRETGVDVAFVRLLGPFDVETGEKWSDSPEGLVELAPVRRLILSQDGRGRENQVIDVESFGFVDHERGVSMRSRVILFNPVSWREPEWR